MSAFKKVMNREITGWRVWDAAWLFTALYAVCVCSVIAGENDWISLTAALTGAACVVLTGKGVRFSFLIGLVNSVLYAYIAWKARYYGEVMLNLFYYVPMGVVGWFVWKKHMNDETGEVVKERLNLKKSALVYAATAAGIFLYGLLLRALGGSLPFTDSMSTVISVVAQILSIRRLAEQWVLWIVVDAVTVVMWAVALARGEAGAAAMLAMWSVYLLNAVIMFIRWYREAKSREV